VARRDDRLRITAELTDVASGSRLWSNAYERPASDVVAVQEEIAGAIVNEGIRVRLSGEERRRLARHPTDDPDAYEFYLRAMHHIYLETEADYLDARTLLRQAIARDSRFALAYLALASTYAVMAIDGFERPTDAWPESNRSIRRALELDADLPDARGAAAAEAFFFRWDWPAAARAWQQALDSPGGQMQPDLLGGYSLQRWALGRIDEALQFARQARLADPLSVAFKVREADLLLQAGRVDPAVELYDRAIKDDPGDPRAYFGLAEARRAQGRFDEAIDFMRRARETAGDRSLDAVISRARGAQGYREIEESAARAQLDALKARAATAYVSPLDVSRLHALLGHRDTAFELLDAAFTDRSAGLVFLNVDRSWNPIRGDSRFAGAVRRVGLS
jgi:serine/threonine-protein kinase